MFFVLSPELYDNFIHQGKSTLLKFIRQWAPHRQKVSSQLLIPKWEVNRKFAESFKFKMLSAISWQFASVDVGIWALLVK